MKKIIFLISLCLFCSVLFFLLNIENFVTSIELLGKLNGALDLFSHYISIIIFCIFIFSMCVLQLILILRKSNFTNYTRLAYEEFKEKRIAKKENKRKAKIEKLQKQLNEIEKDA